LSQRIKFKYDKNTQILGTAKNQRGGSAKIARRTAQKQKHGQGKMLASDASFDWKMTLSLATRHERTSAESAT